MDSDTVYSDFQLRVLLRLQAAWLSGNFGNVSDLLQRFGSASPVFSWDPVAADLPDKRLHAIHEIWTQHRGTDELPQARLCQVSSFGELESIMMVLDLMPDSLRLRYRHYGSELAVHAGSNWQGRTTAEMAQFSEHSLMFASGYLAVAALRQPLYSEIMSSPLMHLTTWCRLLLPYVDERGQIVSFACSNLPISGKPSWRAVGGSHLLREADKPLPLLQRSEIAGLDGFVAMEQNIRNLLARSPTAVLIFSRQSGLTVFYNHSLTDLLGYELPELLNSRPDSIFARPSDFDGIHERIMSGSETRYQEACLRHKLGTEVWTLLSAHEVMYDYNLCVAVWLFDITSQKRAAEDLLAAKAAAEEASRAKSVFLANMSHEIRTPLNAIIGFSELLLETPLSEIQKQYAQNACQSGSLLLDIVNDVLDLAKIEAGKLELDPQATDLARFIDETTSLLAGQAAQKGLSFILDKSPELPAWLMLDPLRLRQVILNLLGNALKFTPSGYIRLALSCTQSGAGSWLLGVVVEDSGIGISDAQKDRLFKAFSQADASTTRRYGGTGLGLIISQSLVEKMGGLIKLDSKESRGSVFSFSIPVQPCDPVAIAACTDGVEQSKWKTETGTTKPAGPRVLIAEDVELNMILTRTLLKAVLPGVRIEEAVDGNQAWSILQNQSFELVLMDIQMPGMDGMELASRIRQQEAGTGRHIPLIAISAGVLEAERQKAMAAGIDDFLAKPLSKEKLSKSLACFL